MSGKINIYFTKYLLYQSLFTQRISEEKSENSPINLGPKNDWKDEAGLLLIKFKEEYLN